jgi:hypothetical protein
MVSPAGKGRQRMRRELSIREIVPCWVKRESGRVREFHRPLVQVKPITRLNYQP